MALNITNENYEALLADSKPLVIDFWAEWCGPCRAIAPIVEELAEEYADKVNIGKCDVDSCDDITANYRVRNIPTLVFIKGGELVEVYPPGCILLDASLYRHSRERIQRECAALGVDAVDISKTGAVKIVPMGDSFEIIPLRGK